MEHKNYMPLRKAADCCGVSPDALYGWIHRAGIKTRHSPEGLLVCAEDIRKYLLRQGLPVPDGLKLNLRIMIVEDDPQILRILARTMRGLWPEADIVTANNGSTAAAQLPVFQPDLLLLDLALPGVNGLKLCRMVRENRELSHTKVLVLTGYSDWETNSKAIESGADEYLTKPFVAQDLCQSAMRLLL